MSSNTTPTSTVTPTSITSEDNGWTSTIWLTTTLAQGALDNHFTTLTRYLVVADDGQGTTTSGAVWDPTLTTWTTTTTKTIEPEGPETLTFELVAFEEGGITSTLYTTSLATSLVSSGSTSDTATISSTTISSSTSQLTSATGTIPTPAPGTSNRLSGGAIAGIVVGILLFIFVCGLGVYMLFRRRRARVTEAPEDPDIGKYEYTGKAELPGGVKPYAKPELGGNAVAEVAGDDQAAMHELEAEPVEVALAELPGSNRNDV